MSFGLSLDALAGSGVTEDKETTVTSGPDEAVRAGGVMERLIHGTGSMGVNPGGDGGDMPPPHPRVVPPKKNVLKKITLSIVKKYMYVYRKKCF